MAKLTQKLIIKTKMKVETGLHIGGSSESVEIGGIDNSVIRRSIDNTPYIPGSSLKGKIRSLLEQMRGAPEIGYNQEINDFFGFTDKKTGVTKLIVRDAYLTKEDKEKLEKSDYLDMPYTEVKSENRIDRVKGTASDPRRMERVPAGVKFDVEFVINVWDEDDDGENLKNLLKEGIKALELDYLGGSGSRGYGKVSFEWDKIENPEVKDMQNLMSDEA